MLFAQMRRMSSRLAVMNYRLCLATVFCLVAALRADSLIAAEQLAKGIVFHDTNRNQKFDPGDQPLPRVRVSNGAEIVRTDQDGAYELEVDDDTILFVIKPAGWRTPLDENNLPKFYYVHKPGGSPESKFNGIEPTGPLPKSVDFPLYPQQEPEQFRAILFGDPQPRNQKEVDYISHDVVEELIGTDGAFGVTLGDIVFDDLSLFGPQAQTIALIGIPWYNVIGNHDINTDAQNDPASDETFERHFGPSYYSFDYGPTHFVVLDNIEWYSDEGDEKATYRGGVGARQLAFVKSDLEQTPDEQLVVLLMHIPIVDIHNQADLFRLIEKRPNCVSVSGHTHYHAHRFLTKEDGWNGAEPHHHIINVTVSGSWWSGRPDEEGVPHTIMRDGAPNGYSIMSFDGNKYSLDFKAARRPAAYQLRVFSPEAVTDTSQGTPVYVNVFNGSERSRVEMRVRGESPWNRIERVVEEDPAYLAVVAAEKAVEEKSWLELPKPVKSEHLWRGLLPTGLPAGTQLIEVRATDWMGRTVTGNRTIRIEKEPAKLNGPP